MNVIIMIGPPGSGKSTWAEKYAKENGYEYLSSDKNRARLGKNEDDQSVSAQAFDLLEREMVDALKWGEDVIVDACFMSRKSRKRFVNTARLYGATLHAVSFELNRDVVLERNSKRAVSGGRNVPVHVIDMKLANYEKPQFPEFDKVTIIDK